METSIIDNLFNTKISLSKAILLFYICLANNYTDNLLSGQVQDFIKTNRIAKHVIGFVTMLVLINTFGGVSEIKPAMAYSLLAYTWFTFTTKLDLRWNLVIFGMMVVGYLYENKLFDRELEASNDENIPEEKRGQIEEINKRHKTWIALAILGVTAIGGYQYYNKKVGQFGGGFNQVDFLLKGSRRELYLN